MESESTIPFWVATDLPVGAIAYAAGLAVLAAVIVGVVPAVRATGSQLESKIRQMGGGTGMRMGRTWTVLIVLQVAVAVAFLPAVVGLAWSNFAPTAVRPTFPANDFLSLRLLTEDPRDPGAVLSEVDARLDEIQAEVIRRAQAEPAVVEVTFARTAPCCESSTRIEVEGGVPGSDGRPLIARSNQVDIRFFEVLSTPLLAGRSFESGDLAAGAAPIVVNRAFVDLAFSGGEAPGRRIRIVHPDRADAPADAPPWLEIVGIVDNLFINTAEPELTSPVFYSPMALGSEPVSILIRARGSQINDPALRQRLVEIATSIEPAVRPLVVSMAGPELNFERRRPRHPERSPAFGRGDLRVDVLRRHPPPS